jgi:diguanylate cyclase (GGDEF)-like protein/PAS domain S-box-containing protein
MALLHNRSPQHPDLTTRAPGTRRWPGVERLPVWGAGLTIAVATLALVGWATGTTELAGRTGDLAAMKLNTALLLLLLGAALLLLRPGCRGREQRTGALLAAIASVAGLFFLGEYLVGGTGVDTLLADDAGARYPGRPSQQAAVTIVAIGAALATVWTRPRLSGWLATGALVLTTFTVVGYVDGVDFLRASTARFGIAVTTIVCLVALVAGLLALTPDRGPLSLLRGDDAGARMARVVLPVTAAVAVVFGAVDAWMEQEFSTGPRVSDALYSLVMVTALVVVVGLTARHLRHSDDRQRGLARIVEAARDAIITYRPDGTITSWNPAAERIFGYAAEEAIGRSITLLNPPGADDAIAADAGEIGAGEVPAQRLTRDGRILDVSLSVTPMLGLDGTALVSTIVRDLTAEKIAEEERRRLTAAVESSADAVAMADASGCFTSWNAAAQSLLGWRADEILGRPVTDIVPQDRQAELAELMKGVAAGRPVVRRETRRLRRDGVEIDVELSITPIMDEDGRLVARTIILRDTRERRAAERALAQSEERFRRSFRDSGIGMAIVELDGPGLGRVLEVNEALAAITGYPEEALHAMEPLATVHPTDLPELAADFTRLAAGALPVIRHEVRMLDASGATLWTAITASLVRDGDGEPQHVVLQTQDISDRKRFEGQLQHLADHDALTGLFNRRRFEEELRRELSSAQRYRTPGAVLVLDLDHFKLVNDTLGHAAGDQLIQIVAELVRGRLRESDILSRMGGDEFAIILPHCGIAESRHLAESLLQEIRDDALAATTSGVGRVSGSIGIAPFGPGTQALGAEDVLAQADIAMYDAKEDGRDRVAVYDQQLARHTRMQARVTWVSRIERALAEDRFVVHAQPIVPVGAGTGPRRFELLLRMLGDGGDLIPPGTFLHVAERSDLAQRIDRWVVTRAVQLLAEQQRLGADIALSVNLSGRSVNDPRTLDHIVTAIGTAGVDPDRLMFEVTETAAIVNIASATEFARRLREIGCRLALDDFGAGFASFYYLKHLSFDVLKIDGEFIKDLPSSHTNQLVVRSVVDIARGMGKQTVAEFVGDQQTMDLLAAYGVDFAQGYFLGPPEALETALARRAERAGPPAT